MIGMVMSFHMIPYDEVLLSRYTEVDATQIHSNANWYCDSSCDL